MARNAQSSGEAFTLVESLVVMAIIAILAALLLPALSSAKAKSNQTACQNNLKQLAAAAQMYVAENDGRLPENRPQPQNTNSWVVGNMANEQDALNSGLISRSELFPYASQVELFRCPADRSETQGKLRVRSYSMNGWLGSRYMETEAHEPGYRTFMRDSELASALPSLLWLLIDEHEASINDGWFEVTMDDSRPFAGFPAARHSNGYSLNFTDGHVETCKLRDPTSLRSYTAQGRVKPGNSDWLRLKTITTTP